MKTPSLLLFAFYILSFCYPQQLFSQYKVTDLLEDGKHEKAMEYCSKQKGDKQKTCFTMMGYHYSHLDSFEDAGKCFLLAENMEMVESTAGILVITKKYEKAAYYYEQAFSGDNQKLNTTYLDIADAAFYNQDYDNAMNYYEKACNEDKDKLKEKYIKVGKGYCTIEEYDKAANLYIKYEYKEGLEYIGDYLLRKKEYELAKTYYNKSKELHEAANSGAAVKSQYYYGLWSDESTGQGYKTVTIGPQVWMATNLNNSTYNDGTQIIRCDDEWMERTGAYCWYRFDSARYDDTYGRLYNWYAVNTGKLCPVGWHVPSTNDWEELETYLVKNQIIDGDGVVAVTAGGFLKEAGDSHWKDPNSGATNVSGFTALPGGMFYTGIKIGHITADWNSKDIERSAYFHTSSEAGENEQYEYPQSYCFKLSFNSAGSTVIEIHQGNGAHVRCLKDQ